MNLRPELKLDWATHKAAKYAVENWHYSGCMPKSKLVKFSVYEDGKFCGVVIFGSGASAVVHKQFKVKRTEICELVRVALYDHITPVSRILSIAVKLLRCHAPGLRVIISFADPAQGHHGGIYQAANWAYTGDSSPTKEYYYNGAWRHVTGIYKSLRKNKAVIKKLNSRMRRGKHRYLMPLDKKMTEQIKHLAKPYPKREKQAMAPPRAQRRGSTDLHAPNSEGSGELFPSIKEDAA